MSLRLRLACRASSFVGTRTRAEQPLFSVEEAVAFLALVVKTECNIGNAYAPVFPDPVRALARMSFPVESKAEAKIVE